MKKHLIRFLAVAFAFAALSLPALSQNAGDGQGMRHGMASVDERVQHLTKMLNLSTDQQAKVKTILEDQKTQMTALKGDTSMSQQDRRTKFQAIHEDTQQKIEGVLNDEQKTKFEQMQAQRKGHMQGEAEGSPNKQ
jgi:periplasmic protein CpxP/Spy